MFCVCAYLLVSLGWLSVCAAIGFGVVSWFAVTWVVDWLCVLYWLLLYVFYCSFDCLLLRRFCLGLVCVGFVSAAFD